MISWHFVCESYNFYKLLYTGALAHNPIYPFIPVVQYVCNIYFRTWESLLLFMINIVISNLINKLEILVLLSNLQ
jgi:hypothetical protein